MKSLEIRKVSSKTDLARLRDFMLTQPQWYPNYREWVANKCIPRIEAGRAEALLVVRDAGVVGDAVYQRVADSFTIELKNFRIDEGYRKRSLGFYLLRQVEAESAALVGVVSGDVRIIADVSVRNFAGVEFFTRNGFKIMGMDELYAPGQAEYLLQK